MFRRASPRRATAPVFLLHRPGYPPFVTDKEKKDQERLAETRMSFGAHLDELRKRLWKALLWSLLGLVVVFCFHRDVMTVVVQPFRDVMLDLAQDSTLKASGPAHAFFSYVKVSFIVGLIFTAPLWIYQIWAFIGAGLYSGERRAVFKYIPFCLVLFLSGVTFGYLVLIPLGLRYLLTFADPTMIQNWIGLKEYLGLFTVLTLVLGFTFQLPVIMIGLARSGIMGPEAFRKKRKWMILLIFIGAAVLTPPDPVTQCLMAMPLIGLYELGIYLSWLGMGKDRPPVVWKQIKPRVFKLVAVLALLAVLWTPLTNEWKKQKADERLYEQEEGRPDMRVLAGQLLMEALKRRVPVEVTTAFRAGGEGREALIACHLEENQDPPVERKVWVVRVVTTRRSSIPIRSHRDPEFGQKLTVGFWSSGAAMFDFYVLPKVQYDEFVPTLLDGYEHGSDRVVEALGPLLADLTGIADTGDPTDSASKWREWYESNKAGTLAQPH